jgi:hypothetical protein
MKRRRRGEGELEQAQGRREWEKAEGEVKKGTTKKEG